MVGSKKEPKRYGLTSLVKEISRQHNFQATAQLLFTALIQISSEREEKHENVKFGGDYV